MINNKNLNSRSTNHTTPSTTSSTSTITATTIIKNDSSAISSTNTTNIINEHSTIIKSPLHKNKQSVKLLTQYESKLNEALHKFTEIDYNNNGITSTSYCCTPIKKNVIENNQDLNLIAQTASTFNRDSIYVVDNDTQASIIIHHHHFEPPNQKNQSSCHLINPSSKSTKYKPNQHKVCRNSQFNKRASSNYPCSILTGGNSNDYYNTDSRNYYTSSNSRNFDLNDLNINNKNNSTVYSALSTSTVTSKTMIFRRILGIEFYNDYYNIIQSNSINQ